MRFEYSKWPNLVQAYRKISISSYPSSFFPFHPEPTVQLLWLQIGNVHDYNGRWIYSDDFSLLWINHQDAARFIDTRHVGFVGHVGDESGQ